MESREKQISLTNRLLFKVGLIVFAALVAAILLGAVDTYYIVMKEESDTVLENLDDFYRLFTNGVYKEEDYQETIFDFWETNYEKMHYIPDGEVVDSAVNENWNETHLPLLEDFSKKQGSRLEAFREYSEEEQLLLAESSYYALELLIDTQAQKIDRDGVVYSVYKYIGNDSAFIYCSRSKGKVREQNLGEIAPLTLSKHPVVSKILKTGQPVNKSEHIVSSTDGQEYLYAARPIQRVLRSILNIFSILLAIDSWK